MRAWLLESLGGLDKLKLGEIADPRAGEGEVVLRVEYAALNPADRYLAEGQYPARPKFPHILGRDGIGTVIEIGSGVSGWNIGERGLVLRSDVGVERHGTLAEKVAVPVASLTRPPETWSHQESAGAPLVYLTAWQALHDFEDLPAGAVVLVSGASGGVGVATIQLARALGHTVVGLSRGTAKRDALINLGAAFVLDPTEATWRKQLKERLTGKRVDLAIDNIGGELFSDMIDTLADRGRVAVIGRLAGPAPQFNTASLLFRRITIRGVFVGAYTPDESQSAWSQIGTTLQKSNQRPLVDRVFPFDQLIDAFDRLKQGPLGKVLIEVHKEQT